MDAKEVRRLFDYDGCQLIWKASPAKNGRVSIGSVAGTKEPSGYLRLQVRRKSYRAHRLVWLWHHGAWPEDQIDHINKIRDDNRIENLRDVTHADNQRNKRKHKNNSSGHNGVSWYPSLEKWTAYICISGKQTRLGYFVELSDAVAARQAAEKEHGYHENHGSVV